MKEKVNFKIRKEVGGNVQRALLVLRDDIVVLPPRAIHNVLRSVAHLDTNGGRLIDRRELGFHGVTNDHGVLAGLERSHAGGIRRGGIAREGVGLRAVDEVAKLNHVLL